jgi:PAS domain S-box-containing protein
MKITVKQTKPTKTNLSERKHAEYGLAESRDLYHKLFNVIDEGFCIIEVIFDKNEKPIDYRFLEINPSFERQTGLVDAQGKRMRELAPQHEEHWFEIYGKIALTGKPARFVNQAKQLHRWYDVYAFRVDQPENHHVAILFNDITQRKQLEESIVQERDYAQNLLKTAQIIILTLDVEGRIVNFNRYFEDLTGHKLNEVKGKDWFTTFLPKGDYGQIRRLFKKALSDIPTRGNINPILTKQGREIFVEWYDTLLKDADGNITGLLSTGIDVTERKQADEKLRESEERFRGLYENATVGIYRTTPDGHILLANPTLVKMLGYSSLEELVKRNLNNEGFAPDHPRVDFQSNIEQKGEIRGHESVWKKKDGSPIHVRESGRAVRDNNGRVLYYEGIVEDISDRIQAELAVRKGEELYRSLFENMLNGFAYCQVHYDKQGDPLDLTYLAVNKAFETQTGLKDVVGKKISEVLPGFRKSDPGLLEIYGRVAKTGKAESIEVFSNALQQWLQISVYSPEREYFVVVFDIITERKRLEEELKESEKKFHTLFNNSEVGMFRTKLDGSEVMEVNKKYLDVFGGTRKEVIGKPSLILWADPHQREEMVRRLKVSGRVVDFECRLLNNKGEIRDCIESMNLYPEEGILDGSVLDITDRKQAEEKIRQQAEELKLLSMKLSETEEMDRRSIARELHDRVGQNLTAMGIQLSIMRNALSEDEHAELSSRLDDCQKLIDETSTQIRDIMADLHPTILDDYGTVAALRWYAQQFSQRTGIPVEFKGKDLEPLLPIPIRIAVFRTAQEVLNNIAKHARAKQVKINVESNKGTARFIIEDNGIGFDLSQAQSQPNSDSWGLRIMNDRIQNVGGLLKIESKPGQGTRVTIEVKR